MLTRFRLGISEIAVHRNRYKAHSDADLVCPLCEKGIENEVHFVLCCPALYDLRKQYIPLKFYKMPNQFRLAMLLACTNEQTMRNVSIYLYKSFKLRSICLS